MRRRSTRSAALGRYGVATAVIAAGAMIAMVRFPGGYDWGYTVISMLASSKHNPAGGVWLSGGLLVGAIVLWPAVRQLGHAAHARRACGALQLALLGAALLGLEGVFQLDYSGVLRKGHELVALGTFLCLYGGVLGLYVQRIRRDAAFLLPALAVLLPLVATGASQLALYFGQRELGWVNTGWRELGVPLWLSFAFWQWTAVVMLGLGLGWLIAAAPRESPAVAGSPPTPTRRS
jgi:hypothetical protein